MYRQKKTTATTDGDQHQATMGSSVSDLHAAKRNNQTSSNQLARKARRQLSQRQRQRGAPSKSKVKTPSTPNKMSKPNDPSSEPSSEPSGILHLAIERQVAPIQGHDGGNIMVLHKVGILAKLVFADDKNGDQVQVDKLRAALGVLHSNDPCVYVVHDYNARGIPGTRQVKLLFASKNVLRSSVDV